MSASRESTPAIAADSYPGGFARLVDVVVDPRAAFGAIAERPSWLAAFGAVVAARFLSLFAFYRPDATPAKLVAGIAFQVATVTPLALLSAALLWASSRAWSIRLSWSTALSIAVHVLFVYTIATIAAASIAGAILPATVAVNLREPPFVNLGALADAEQSPVLARLLGEVDVRSAYALILTALGLRAAHPTISRPRVAGAVASCLAVRVVAATWLG